MSIELISALIAAQADRVRPVGGQSARLAVVLLSRNKTE